jgi:hypothetical protein
MFIYPVCSTFLFPLLRPSSFFSSLFLSLPCPFSPSLPSIDINILKQHSKALLREALTADVAFLAENDGIDFSLLIGVADSTSELVVGLIDTIGTFNTMKHLEHRAKTAAKLATLAADGPSTVTILPPSEYAKRFLSGASPFPRIPPLS